jgi:tryptophan-rich sensory protein
LEATQKHKVKPHDSTPAYLQLAAFLLICLLISALGGWVTAGSVDSWYPTLQKPAFNPPDWVFAPVWTILFILIAVSGWRVWRRRRNTYGSLALSAYALQLSLNLLWSVLFFGLRRVDLAAAEIVALLLAILLNIWLFLRIDRPAAYLLVPYALWVAFAAALNFSIWTLN